jgi:hypothetical protein
LLVHFQTIARDNERMDEARVIRIIEKISTAIEKNPLAESVSINGTSISMPNANDKLEFWEKKMEQIRGGRPIFYGVNTQRVVL